MERPTTPEPNHRFKTTQTVTAPSGYTFEYCLDSDENDCDVSSDIAASQSAISEILEIHKQIFG